MSPQTRITEKLNFKRLTILKLMMMKVLIMRKAFTKNFISMRFYKEKNLLDLKAFILSYMNI